MTGGTNRQFDEPTDSQYAAELVRAIAEDVRGKAVAREEQRGRANTTSRLDHSSLLVALVAILGLVLFIDRRTGVAEVPTETSLRQTVYLTALALNAEFDETGAYPSDLEIVGMDEPSLTYTADSGGYTLVGEEDGTIVAYLSGEDLEPFRVAFDTLVTPLQDGR